MHCSWTEHLQVLVRCLKIEFVFIVFPIAPKRKFMDTLLASHASIH